MADLLSSSREPNPTRKLLAIGLALIAAAAVAFAVFYKHENHPPVEATVTRVLTLPVHTKYVSQGRVAGPDQTEDVLYVIAVLNLRDGSENPLFIKDIAGSLILQDGRENSGRLIGPRDRERLQQLVPAIRPLLQQTGFPPLDPETKIEAKNTGNGYIIFLYPMPPDEWAKRQSAIIRLDFYHQDSVTAAVPK